MLAAGLSGCLKSETSATLVAQAQQFLQKGDSRAALIQLKNAADKSPQDGEIRLLLARVYNDNSEAALAEKEVRKALSLKVERARALPQLLRALLAQDKAKEALAVSEADAASAGPALLAVRGDAWLALGDGAKAREAYAQALAGEPGQADALLGQARLAQQAGDRAAALALAEQALRAHRKTCRCCATRRHCCASWAGTTRRWRRWARRSACSPTI